MLCEQDVCETQMPLVAIKSKRAIFSKKGHLQGHKIIHRGVNKYSFIKWNLLSVTVQKLAKVIRLEM